MAITNRDLPAGTKLVARYKGQHHAALVLVDDAGKPGYELDGKTIYRSLSAAGSAVMGGTACNGWRFWSVEGTEPGPKAKEEKKAAKAKSENGKAVRQLKRVPNQRGVPEGETKWFCSACQASFLAPAGEEPQACPQGHPHEAEDELAPLS